MIGVFLIILLFTNVITYALCYNNYANKFRRLIDTYAAREESVRKEAIAKSKSVIRGQVSEHLVPMIPNFPYNPMDCHFIGQPIDYLVFKNMSDVRDGNTDESIEIILTDVKVNKSQLTTIQRQIKTAVEQGRVRFEAWKLDENNKLTVK